MRITISQDHDWSPPPKLPVCIARRTTRATNPPYGYDDIPTQLEGEYHCSADGRIKEWHPRACRYDLQIMETWGSYKAMLYLKCADVVDELGLRVGLCLAKENPDYWP